MTTVDIRRLHSFRDILHAQLDQQTAVLTKLTAHRTNPEQIG
jgi:hypothetical protein